METGLWALVVVLAVGLGYTLRFTAATLAFGRELSGSTSTTGFQDAITPPWQTKLAITVYIGIAAVVLIMWWQLGWVSVLLALLAIVVVLSVATLVLPKASGGHYRRVILRSMIARYANYVRDRDALRAEAMKHLLTRAGMDPDTMRGATTGPVPPVGR